MKVAGPTLWRRYRAYRYDAPDFPFSMDVSRVRFDDDYLPVMAARIRAAVDSMDELEAGAVANVDERRMVGHYWLRAPEFAPTGEIREAIQGSLAAILEFADRVHSGALQGADGPFQHLVHVAIGGSTIGTQMLCGALPGSRDGLTVHFLDNVDPDGLDRLIDRLGGALGRTLASYVSKSGWTPTPRLMWLQLEAAYRRRGLDIHRHAVATTMAGTELDAWAIANRWLARFPLWEWVGGKNSVLSAVGLLPAALRGDDIRQLLGGAAAMDRLTRDKRPANNPAALLALMWYWLGQGRGTRDMVLLPYGDRLASLPRYLQMLVMESLGKAVDRSGTTVHQGLTVYGHKGATDQHTYVQQLRDGPADFFVVFIQARDGDGRAAVEVEPGLTLGDHLYANLDGTREALYRRGRDSITISVPDLGPFSIGLLIALFERAIGLYAELVNLNAYHQPGVEKAVAAPTIELQREIVARLKERGGPSTAEQVAERIGASAPVETIFEILERLAAGAGRGVVQSPGATHFDATFRIED